MCIGPKAGDADLWIEILEELHCFHTKETVVEVEQVKAHAQQDKKRMSHFEKYVAKDGVMWDEGFKAKARASTVQQERERERWCTALQHAASLHCLVEEWKECEDLSRSQKKIGSSWTRKETKRSTERSGVLLPTSIDV